MSNWLTAPETRRVKTAIDARLAGIADDRVLEDRLQGMLTDARFPALWWYWAPRLYERNRAYFRTFIVRHHTRHLVEPGGRWRRWRTQRIEWRAEVAASLEPWLARLERAGDAELFQLLYGWKHPPRGTASLDSGRWCADLLAQFLHSPPGGRARVLDLYDMEDGELDEQTAQRLYAADARLARPFILRHLERTRGRRWRQLAKSAQDAHDDDFCRDLYRAQVTFPEWLQEALKLCGTVNDRDALVESLERRHPASARSGDFGHACCLLLTARGADVLPYLYRHVSSVRRGVGSEELLRLAQLRGWIRLWAAVTVVCADRVRYNAAVREVLEDRSLREPERVRRLALLCGVSREWSATGVTVTRVRRLSAANALRLHAHRPQLCAGLFHAHVMPGMREPQVALFEQAWAAGDDDLADTLASGYVTQRAGGRAWRGVSDFAAEKYLALKPDAGRFVRRTACVLTRIPAGAIPDYAGLIRENRLARLLFEGSLPAFLELPGALADLLEGAEVHVRHLGYRVLGLADARAAELAVVHLDLLLAALLTPMRRTVRLAAFAALERAASRIEHAQLILERARQACVLPGQALPVEPLLGLIARLLARHPPLARPDEQPIIHRRTR